MFSAQIAAQPNNIMMKHRIMSMNESVLHPNLAGRVAIVTGASRGIGKARALRLAREGADVVIAAQSEACTEKLPGSIYDTANEVRALGRRTLAVPPDVRSEDAIANMVSRTVEEFGRADILVNNAGAIWSQPIWATTPKKFDDGAGECGGRFMLPQAPKPHTMKKDRLSDTESVHGEDKRYSM